jgi:quinolinate synthase
MEDKDETADLVDKIGRLRKAKNATILAHNYQLPAIQDIADFVGDSLELSRIAATTIADTIVFCGVHFMAETAAILAPDKKVLIPDLQAGCSLSDTIDANQLRQWKLDHPGAVVVSYVNTTAEVKAESDYCCTSSNAVKIVNAIPADKEVLFLPDMFLGAYVKKMTGRRNLHVWWGECHVHAALRPQDVKATLAQHPGADLMIHPECGCSTSALHMISTGDIPTEGTHILSTGGMIRHARASTADKFVVATETGILHRLKKDNPNKRFIPMREDAVCGFMKMITLEKVCRSLENEVYEVVVPEEIAVKANLAIERMISIG